MGFIAPAVHYSALATLPPELTSSKTQQSIKHTTSVPSKLSQIFKKLLSNEHTIPIEFKESIQSPKTTVRLSETVEKENDTSIIVKNPDDNNNSGNRTSTGQESPKAMPSLMEPLERLPFTEPYFSIAPKNEKFPFELSTYHKHCIHQQKFIDQKQYQHESSSIKQMKTVQPNSSLSSSMKENRADSTNYQLKNLPDQQLQIKFKNKKSNSTTTLPVSASIENRIGLKYASLRNPIATNHGIRSSYVQQQTQHLRRLQSKSKVRPISNETKSSSLSLEKNSIPSSSISSSIAHRIELLKKSMHNHQLEVHHLKSEKSSSIEPLSSHPLIDSSIHKQTQTKDNHLKSSEIHHIHHHHIHSSSFLSVEWRTYLSIIGTFFIIFLLLFELITIIF